ncbi:von Willebrand factor type A domain-containing protein [Myxococcus sp. XM-1-1-1]|uniref:vWA domain-containing protein n=1 Tax=Myxococcus sp. XM-1-1-1 TaxID=2874602 RepID=UPI001CBD0CCB|nr:von Willebrand factor type A domain-containing protein [Myxococcus sp. XM-1-1-1]MBZ4408882.1 von Willebrand factor type A domain-containing protein [Myxococcus sp. XM-1-1-1]
MSKRFTRILVTLFVTLALLGGGVTLYGDNIRKLFGASASSLTGNHEAVASDSEGLQRKSMRTFGNNDAYGDSDTGQRASVPVAQAPAPSGAPQAINPRTDVREDALSTFAVDVDTASYTQFRRSVTEHQLPHPSNVRVEEWVNYFRYAIPAPPPGQGPFHVALEAAPSPFAERQHLLKVSLQGRHVPRAERKPTHLVFLVDTSGSMQGPDRLALVQKSVKLAVEGLNPHDTVAITTYAGGVSTVLEPTPAKERKRINAAIDALSAGGGTAMGDGLELAYRQAVRMAGSQRVSRVIVLTDGDTNLGRNQTVETMLGSIRRYVKEGVTLSTIGFGMGNYRDELMEKLANQGNGNCYYIDSEREAQRVFRDQLGGTLEVIAQDVKIQVEFDRAAVRAYRLLGYENRAIADADFRKDDVDAGEVGAGHTVTALYELDLTGKGDTVATVRVRAKKPGDSEAAEQRFVLNRNEVKASLDRASEDLRFAAAVASTADLLRGTLTTDERNFSRIHSLAADATHGQEDRVEFLTLLGKLRQLLAPRLASSSR